MSEQVAKKSMMRFEPDSGWHAAEAADAPVNEVENKDNQQETPELQLSADALIHIGESIQDVFNSLKINDPRLQVWTQVHSAIRLLGGKVQEKNSLEARIGELKSEIEGLRILASELVVGAYQNELEVNATSKLRLQIAESLNEKLMSVLKN